MPNIFDSITNKKLDKRLLIKTVLKKIVDSNVDSSFCYSKTTKDTLRQYIRTVDSFSSENVRILWKSILMDSISFLKINDKREKLNSSTEFYLSQENGKETFQSKFDAISRTSSFGIDELDKYFDEFVDFEKVLYGTIDSYRSHVEHVIQVWAIGLALIDYAPTISFGKEVDCLDLKFSFDHNKEKKLFITKGEIFAMWSIIALCHDLGYPIEKISRINTPLKKIISHFGSININEFDYTFSNLNNSLIEKFLTITSSKPIIENDGEGNFKSGRTAVQSKYKDKIAKSLEDCKHGSYSSLLIFKTLTFFLETDIYCENNDNLTFEDTRQFLIRREILRSICGHTCPKLYHIQTNTLPFILILSDELQEFGRPRFDDNRLSISSVDNIESWLLKYDFVGDNSTICVKFQYNDIPIIKLRGARNYPKALDNKDFYSLDKKAKEKFKMFHHLLRSAKDDYNRNICFEWQIFYGEKIKYIFKFDSTDPNLDHLEIKMSFFKVSDNDKWNSINIYG